MLDILGVHRIFEGVQQIFFGSPDSSQEMSAYSINMGNNGKVYSLASIVAVESDIEPKFVTEVT